MLNGLYKQVYDFQHVPKTNSQYRMVFVVSHVEVMFTGPWQVTGVLCIAFIASDCMQILME